MKKFTTALTCLAACFTLGLTACGDDKDPVVTTDTSTTDTTTTDVTVTEEVTGTEDVTEDVATPAGKCTNEADLAIITDTTKDATGKATTCGLDNIADVIGGDLNAFAANTKTCMNDAEYKDDPKYAFVLSSDCTDCYVASVRCTAEFCLNDCGADPSSAACNTCRVDNDCFSSFFACSGLTPPAPAE